MKLYRVNDNLEVEEREVIHWQYGYQIKDNFFTDLIIWLLETEKLAEYGIAKTPEEAIKLKELK